MPASENMKSSRAKAIIGWLRASPARSPTPSTMTPRRFISRMMAKTTRAMRSPSRSSRVTVVSSRMQLPFWRTASAMLSYNTLMPLRGYMYFVK